MKKFTLKTLKQKVQPIAKKDLKKIKGGTGDSFIGNDDIEVTVINDDLLAI